MQIAVAKFRAIIINDDGIVKIHKVKVNTKPVNSTDVLKHNLELYANDKDMELQETGRSLVFIKEQGHIE